MIINPAVVAFCSQYNTLINGLISSLIPDETLNINVVIDPVANASFISDYNTLVSSVSQFTTTFNSTNTYGQWLINFND